MYDIILLKNNLAYIPDSGDVSVSDDEVGTIIANLAYFGYAPSLELLERIKSSNSETLSTWWNRIESALKSVTGDDLSMADYVVYKNFPDEVLEMSQAKYWYNQICMYMGFPKEYFTQEERDREPLNENLSLQVLHLAGDGSIENILSDTISSSARWTDFQKRSVFFLIFEENFGYNVGDISFKENLVAVAKEAIARREALRVNTGTDVLRLAAGLSDGDISLRQKVRFKRFSRSQRKMLLGMLESCPNLKEDIAMREEIWKRFLHSLHPGDYKARFPRVISAADDLYKGNLEQTFNSKIEEGIAAGDSNVLKRLSLRPGIFARRLRKAVSVFGKEAVDSFRVVIPKLSTIQLLKLKNYLIYANIRNHRVFPPKGNWSNLKIVENSVEIDPGLSYILVSSIESEIASRINDRFPEGVYLDPSAYNIKIQDNDSSLTDYGRGTRFSIPDDVQFIRTASYWKNKTSFNNWFDNGWNFFNEEWSQKGACCWNSRRQGALFSGDPVNSQDKEGKACQIIDLNIDELIESGVRYAVWSVLCFSGIKFDEAEEVYACLEWGEDARRGKLLEPARSKLSFPITGSSLTKFIAYVDLQKRELVYLDMNLRAKIRSAVANTGSLSNAMPAIEEYLDTLPSVGDLFNNANKELVPGKGAVVSWSDKDIVIDGGRAFVFRPENEENNYEPISISNLLKN